MIAWTHGVLMTVFVLASASLASQSSESGASGRLWLRDIRGRVVADGRPVDFNVEVRLDTQAVGKTLATTHTLGSDEFDFPLLEVGRYDTYYLVVEHDGYAQFRQELALSSFSPNPRFPGMLDFSGLLLISLTSRASDADAADLNTGPSVVDLRQLTLEVAQEARDAYESALEDLALRREAEALEHLEAAVEIEPDYYDALNKLGMEYLKAGRYRDGEARLERARELAPNDPRPLTNLGALHLQEGQVFDAGGQAELAQPPYTRAIRFLEEAIRLDPRVPEANFYLGAALYETGDYERAEALLLEALERDPRLSDAHLTLMNVYNRLGRYSDALSQIEAYLETNPDSPRRPGVENIKSQIEQVLGRQP